MSHPFHKEFTSFHISFTTVSFRFHIYRSERGELFHFGTGRAAAAPHATPRHLRVRTKKAAAVAAAPSSAALKTHHWLHRDQLARLLPQGSRWRSLGSPIVPLSPPPCPHKQMRGEAATRTRCSAARWFRSLVLALSKCLVAAAPKIRPAVSMAPADRVAGPAACQLDKRRRVFRLWRLPPLATLATRSGEQAGTCSAVL
mgnify:CR=1 FL=1